jgi:hypothetical protein
LVRHAAGRFHSNACAGRILKTGTAFGRVSRGRRTVALIGNFVHTQSMRYAFPVLWLASSVVLLAEPARACMCPETDPDAEIGMWGDLVFEAEVLESVFTSNDACIDEGMPLGMYYLLGVSRVWAGAVNQSVVMYSDVNSCSTEYSIGDRFIVNASRYDGILYVPGLCSQRPTADQATAAFGDGVPAVDGHEELPACLSKESETNECGCVTASYHGLPRNLFVLALLFQSVLLRRRQIRVTR